jgi:serine/threonine-protein kinase TTK/MPS1
MGDSSDEDIPAPMKFSALTKALLNDEPSVVESSSPSSHPNVVRVEGGIQEAKESSQTRNRSTSIYEYDQSKRNANTITGGSPVFRRVVRLSGGSISPLTTRRSNSAPESPLELITPAPVSRRILNKSSGNSSADNVEDDSKHAGSPENSNDGLVYPTTIARPHTSNNQGSVSRFGGSTVGRTRHEDTIAQGSIRVKRVGKVTGSFLSGPARRGRRRQSEEDQSPEQDVHASSHLDGPPIEKEIPGAGTSVEAKGLENIQVGHLNPVNDGIPTQNERGPRNSNHAITRKEKGPWSVSPSVSPKRQTEPASRISSRPLSPNQQLSYKMPGLPTLPASHDQENEPPPTFKRNKPSAFSLLDTLDKNSVPGIGKAVGGTPLTMSPSRKPLAPRSHNTPHRPAPPPPKMSVLETATATAGSAATASRKKRINITLNGKTYTRMDLIGRGGSARVYRVMAENHKIFALKKVSLEDVDQLAIRGYKGEIDLLRKLESVDRVVRLYDWEINEEKQTLSVVSP